MKGEYPRGVPVSDGRLNGMRSRLGLVFAGHTKARMTRLDVHPSAKEYEIRGWFQRQLHFVLSPPSPPPPRLPAVHPSPERFTRGMHPQSPPRHGVRGAAENSLETNSCGRPFRSYSCPRGVLCSMHRFLNIRQRCDPASIPCTIARALKLSPFPSGSAASIAAPRSLACTPRSVTAWPLRRLQLERPYTWPGEPRGRS